MGNGQTGKRGAGANDEAAAPAVAVGANVNAYCGNCMSVTCHIVLEKIGAKPTRVECRDCHAMHAYKPSASSRATST